VLPVNELFQTIQGEGMRTGAPSVFLRLQGCDVGCPWCDTKHTWSMQAEQIHRAKMITKGESEESFVWMEVSDLVESIVRYPARNVVITGGEPCQYDLSLLCKNLWLNEKEVQIETSGTEQIRCHSQTWVTLSPKIGMPGGKEVRADAVERANEIKMPIGKVADVGKLLDFIGFYQPTVPIFVQPLSTQQHATELCISAATEYGWRVSLQAHKMAGLR
jgi:7-carboxy-7-deazaguanine synthase